jgi:hypothetical protein
MRRLFLSAMAFLLVIAAATAQSDRLETFQSSFSSANLQTKLEILRASDGEDPAAFGPLYGQALSYVVSNAEMLEAEQLLREIALVSIRRIEAGAYRAAVNDLWRLYRLYEETTARIEVIGVLASLAGDSPATIDGMNEWVLTQNNLTRSGTRVDLQVLAAMTGALGEIGDTSSFPAVLDVILVGYPDFVSDTALDSLGRLDGVPLEMATAFVIDQDIPDRYAPFAFFMENDYLTEADRLELARVTLGDTLRLRPQEQAVQEEARRIRFLAATIIREGQYADATAVAIRHFNETVLEFERGRIARDRLLEAIGTLGAVGTEDAAIRLAEYLELLNTYTEIDRPYDTQIVLSTISNLQILDYPSSYNALFATMLLENYPRRIRDAAEAAMRSVAQ